MQKSVLARPMSGREDSRFFFQNETYMVGDVAPNIHFKNLRTASR
jgi:hypothetical protein